MKLTRKELYEQVWSEPIAKLARKYYLSDVGLAKICSKHNIPRPSRGWWAQQQAGYKVQRTPLPKANDDYEIWIAVDHKRAADRNSLRGIAEAVRPKKSAPEKFYVPDVLTDTHPIVASLEEALSSVMPDANGLVPPPLKYSLNVYVSPGSLPRALRIMDALIKFLESKGHRTRVAEGRTVVEMQGVTIPISLTEGLKPERLKACHHDLEGDYQFGYNKYARNVPSGRLELKIDLPGSVRNRWSLRQSWRDTADQRLEDVLYTFAWGLVKTAAAMRADKEKDG